MARWHRTPGDEPRLVNLDTLTDIEVTVWPENGATFAIVGYVHPYGPTHNNDVILATGFATRAAAYKGLAGLATELGAP